MKPSRQLIVFAFVADGFAKTGDITTGLEPLFAPILQRHTGSRFDPELFAREISETYGIAMHPYVALDLAPKLVQAGLLHAVAQGSEVVGYINLDKGLTYPELNEEQIAGLTSRFISFARERQAGSLPRVGAVSLAQIEAPDFRDVMLRQRDALFGCPGRDNALIERRHNRDRNLIDGPLYPSDLVVDCFRVIKRLGGKPLRFQAQDLFASGRELRHRRIALPDQIAKIVAAGYELPY
jgi:hypothetical protein